MHQLTRATRLYLPVVVLLATVSSSLAPQSSGSTKWPRPLTRWDTVAHDLLKELVEINTSQSVGSTAQAAKAMAAHLKAAGFPDSDVVVVENAPRKGNLVARLRSKNSTKKAMLLLSHIDVVEAKAEDWTLPPFKFTEKADSFFARGIADDKDDGAINLTLIMRLRAEHFVPDRDIIVALTTDEEGGPDNGVDYILKNRPALLDAEFAFNEGGSGTIKDGKYVSHDVQASEKKVQNFQLESTNPGGHSSRPLKDNAITHLSAALVKVGAFDFPVHLNEITRAYFEKSAAFVNPSMGAAMRAIVKDPADAAAAVTLSNDPGYNSQLRTTCVATLLEGGHAANALPQRARATVNCRILPDEDPKDVQRALEQTIGDPKVVVSTLRQAQNSPPSPLTKDLMAQIERITAQMWPGITVIPTMSTGATDSRFLRNKGIPVYGAMGQFYGDANAHGMNERIPQRGFYDSLDYMYRIVTSISKPIVP